MDLSRQFVVQGSGSTRRRPVNSGPDGYHGATTTALAGLLPLSVQEPSSSATPLSLRLHLVSRGGPLDDASASPNETQSLLGLELAAGPPRSATLNQRIWRRAGRRRAGGRGS